MENWQHSCFDPDENTKEKRIERICERMKSIPFTLPVIQVPLEGERAAVLLTDYFLPNLGRRTNFEVLVFEWNKLDGEYQLKSNMPNIHTKRRKYQQVRKPQTGRKTDNSKLYNSQAWRTRSKANLKMNPFCEECLKLERYVMATVSDHINPITQDGEIWDWNNIQSLCTKCHNQKSGREAHSHLNNYGKEI